MIAETIKEMNEEDDMTIKSETKLNELDKECLPKSHNDVQSFSGHDASSSIQKTHGSDHLGSSRTSKVLSIGANEGQNLSMLMPGQN